MEFKKIILITVTLTVCLSLPLLAVQQSPLIKAMKTELDRSFKGLQHANDIPMYYLSYHVTDSDEHNISASYGAISSATDNRTRTLDTDCRVGDHSLDNTSEIRGEYSFGDDESATARLPLEDDALAIRTVIWQNTDEAYKNALERYTKVKANQQVLAAREDTSGDFSIEKPNVYIGQTVAQKLNNAAWQDKIARWSAMFKDYPFITSSSVTISVTNDNRYFVDSDGALIQTGQSYARLFLTCSGACDDGMTIDRYQSFDSFTPDSLPGDQVVISNIQRLADELQALLKAPMAEPYAGPAILVNRASGVFFHEIFGHRIEGHRQKSENEGQTFARKVGQPILPDFISIYDDPTLDNYNGTFLRGHYLYDDEGVKAQRVPVVEKGVLENFLLSRSPIKNFPYSNGHGRMQAGMTPVSRQGNLMVQSTKEYPFDSLLVLLKDECRKQDKPYGLIFYDISGGFTQTGRYGPQSFKVIPLLVYRYYPDGKMEPIRGVDIVGTPLASFEKIIATGNDYATFDGTCGAESGWVPVSATSPSILVSQMEVERKMKEQDKPPILPPPYTPQTPKSNNPVNP